MNALYRTDELRQIELAESARLVPGALMERAGHAAAAWLHQSASARPASFLVLCGPGNNGGDGFVCARALRELGHDCLCWAPADSTSQDARAARSAWSKAGGTTCQQLPVAQRFDVVVDAMFGIGLARPLSGTFLDASEWAGRSGSRVVALDVPSGLNADTGTWIGAVAGLAAQATLTFLGDKPGLHTNDGCDASGLVHVDGLGLPDVPSRGRINSPEQFAALLRRRPQNSHKGRFGSLAVIGGATGMLGAPVLAARAALRLGAGRVYLCCIGGTDLKLDPVCPELMIRPFGELPALQAVVIGCGMGTSAAACDALRNMLALHCPVVVDADALNLISGDAAIGRLLSGREAPTVLTPHPLEAARLLRGPSAASLDPDRVGAATELARTFRAIAVLKGAGTVIVDGRGEGSPYWINPTGGPALSSAGTGDVLAGMIGAQLAQGFDPVAAALGAVWLHGRAAQVHGADLGLLASEIPVLAVRELARLKLQS